MNTIVLTVEGIGAGQLGCFGSALARTPVLDQLAARGIVLDQCFLDSCRIDSQLRSLWTGCHALQSNFLPSLWQLCSEAGIENCLITDSPSVAELAERMGCRQATLVSEEEAPQVAETIEECRVQHLFSTAAEQLHSRSGLIWVHSQGLRSAWDAPMELRTEFADPEDPDPPSECGPPSFEVTADTDPDLIVGWGQVAAAQVCVFDDALATLVAAQRARSDAADWTWAWISLGGTPLGEHGRVGLVPDAAADPIRLHGEELHAPAFLVPAAHSGFHSRRSELFQLPDLGTTLRILVLAQTGAVEPAGELSWGRDLLSLSLCDSPQRWNPAFQSAMIQSGEHTWLRTPAWGSVHHSEDAFPSQLYVKPDDRWEVSDVADRRSDIVQLMKEAAVNLAAALRQNNRGLLAALPEELVNLLR